MILTTVFATLGAVGAGGTAWAANEMYFNKDNAKATAGWTAAWAAAGCLAVGTVGYGVESFYDMVTALDDSAHVMTVDAPQDALAPFASKLTIA